jgi:hypothetical protein
MTNSTLGNMVLGLTALLLLLSPTCCQAFCFKDCRKTKNADSPAPNSIGYMADSVRYRERSHNTGDVKNSVMGDVNIRVGHEKLDIRLDSGTEDNSVDASISSTIILGDMKR